MLLAVIYVTGKSEQTMEGEMYRETSVECTLHAWCLSTCHRCFCWSSFWVFSCMDFHSIGSGGGAKPLNWAGKFWRPRRPITVVARRARCEVFVTSKQSKSARSSQPLGRGMEKTSLGRQDALVDLQALIETVATHKRPAVVSVFIKTHANDTKLWQSERAPRAPDWPVVCLILCCLCVGGIIGLDWTPRSSLFLTQLYCIKSADPCFIHEMHNEAYAAVSLFGLWCERLWREKQWN